MGLAGGFGTVCFLLDELAFGEGVMVDFLAFLQCFGDGSKNGMADPDLVLRLPLRVSATVRFGFVTLCMVLVRLCVVAGMG